MKNITLIFVSGLLTISTAQASFCHFPSINDNTEIITDENDEIDGLYSGTQDVNGIQIIATLRITGKTWVATSKMNLPGATTEYQRGTISGTDLWDESGMMKLGYVSENTAYVQGFPKMTKEIN